MAQIEKTVFISYRRTNSAHAHLIYRDLTAHGFDAFIDVEAIAGGEHFPDALRAEIRARAHFVLVLTPSSIERFLNDGDFVRMEIEYAIDQQRNIIPLVFDGFDFGAAKPYFVSPQLKQLGMFTGVPMSWEYLGAALERLRSDRFLSKPIDVVLGDETYIKVSAIDAPTNTELEAEKFFEQGIELSRKSKYEAAIEAYNQAIDLKPDFAEAYFKRGHSKWNLDRQDDALDDALEDYRQAVTIDPHHPKINIMRAYLASHEKRHDEALRQANAAVALNPESDEAFFARARVYSNLENHEQAIRDYDEALRLNPDDAKAYNNRGNAYRKLKDYEQAIHDYDQAIRLNPDYAKAYNNRGVAYSALKDYEQAIRDYDQAIRLNPDYANDYYNRGNAYRKLKDYEQAIHDYDQAIRLNPDYAMAYNNRGLAYSHQGDKQQAIKDWEQTLQIDPDHEFARQNLAIVKRELGE